MYYQIVAHDPAAHIFKVKCFIDSPASDGQVFSLPAWIPGSYMVRDFAKNIIRINARSDGKPVRLEKIDKSSWKADVCAGSLELEYEVYAWDLSVRSAHLDQTHGYFNGTSVFVRVHGHENKPCRVEICAPVNAVLGDWRVATTLKLAGAKEYGFGRYAADDYEDLIDHPVEMADFSMASFDVAGVRHEVVFTGKHRADLDRVCIDLNNICQTHVDFFGELPKMEKYLFQIMVVGDGYGGLEHRSSTSLLVSRKDLPIFGDSTVSPEYQTFLGLCSHEYFHTWNIKRIKPEAFTPYMLEAESYTRQLWAFEGITSYFDDLVLVRSGCIGVQDYLTLLAQTMTRVWRGKGRFKQSVADSSFEAWTKFYRQDENAPNAIVSYYTKGSLIALALDLTICKLTNYKKSLDDLMSLLWLKYGKSGQGVPEGLIEQHAEEIAGADLTEFFQKYLYGTDDPPLAELLQSVGIEFVLRPTESSNDKGGKSSQKSCQDLLQRAELGVRTIVDKDSLKIANVFDDGAAIKVGLAAGDVLVAIDGLKVAKDNLETLLQQYRPGEVVDIHLFRRDELMSFKLELQPPALDTIDLRLSENVDAEIMANRKAWLKS